MICSDTVACFKTIIYFYLLLNSSTKSVPMGRIYLFLLLLFWGFLSLHAQVATIVPSSYAPGNAFVAYNSDWQPFQNPAALGQSKNLILTVLYENRYITRELGNAVASVAVPTKYINIGASFSYFGYASYNEILSAITVSRSFGEKLNIGVEFDYYTLYLSSSERYRGTFTTQVGVQLQVLPNFMIGINVFNPVFSKIKTDLLTKSLPSVFSLGTNYRLHEKVSWLVQVDKEVHSSVRWATGFEYAFFDEFMVRVGGYGSDYFVPTLGAAVAFDGFRFHLHTEYRYPLGLTMMGVLQYQFK